MSADQSIIDLTNETQEELLNETHDDIEIVSQKLRNNDEPIVCKTTSKKRRLSSSPDIDILEISDSSARTKVNCRRRHNTQDISINDDPISVTEELGVSSRANASNNLVTPINVPKPAPPVISPGFECPICLEKHKDNLVVTTCGHIFCKACLKESLKASKQCPKCRKKISAKSFHPIFI